MSVHGANSRKGGAGHALHGSFGKRARFMEGVEVALSVGFQHQGPGRGRGGSMVSDRLSAAAVNWEQTGRVGYLEATGIQWRW